MVDVSGVGSIPSAGRASKTGNHETVDLSTSYGAQRLEESLPHLTFDEAGILLGQMDKGVKVELPSHAEINRRINEEGIKAVVERARSQLNDRVRKLGLD